MKEITMDWLSTLIQHLVSPSESNLNASFSFYLQFPTNLRVSKATPTLKTVIQTHQREHSQWSKYIIIKHSWISLYSIIQLTLS